MLLLVFLFFFSVATIAHNLLSLGSVAVGLLKILPHGFLRDLIATPLTNASSIYSKKLLLLAPSFAAAYSCCSSSAVPKIPFSLITHILRGTTTIRPSWHISIHAATTTHRIDGRAYYLVAIIRAQKKTRLAQLPKIHTPRCYPHKPCALLHTTHRRASVRVRFSSAEGIRQSLRYHIESNCSTTTVAAVLPIFFLLFSGPIIHTLALLLYRTRSRAPALDHGDHDHTQPANKARYCR